MDIYVARLGCSLASVSVAASSLRVQQSSCDTDTVFKNATASGANKPAGSHIYRENTGRRQEKKEKREKERSGIGWYYLHILMAQTQKI